MSTWVVVIATGTDTDTPHWHSEVVQAPTRDAAMVRAGAQLTALIEPILSVTVRHVPEPPRRYPARKHIGDGVPVIPVARIKREVPTL